MLSLLTFHMSLIAPRGLSIALAPLQYLSFGLLLKMSLLQILLSDAFSYTFLHDGSIDN